MAPPAPEQGVDELDTVPADLDGSTAIQVEPHQDVETPADPIEKQQDGNEVGSGNDTNENNTMASGDDSKENEDNMSDATGGDTPKSLGTPADSPVPLTVEKGEKRKDDHDADVEDQYVTASLPPAVLSDRAIDARLRRVFNKRKDGSMILDDEWNKMWLDKTSGGGREQLLSIFEKCAYVVERGCLKKTPHRTNKV